MIKQKEAVVNAVTEVLGSDFIPSNTIVRDILNKEQKTEVRKIVLAGILNGEVAYAKTDDTEKATEKYVNSMVDNHFRKAKELNGGATYKAQSTGTRRDPQLKEMNKLLKNFPEDTEQHSQILEQINLRNTQLDEIRAQKRSAASVEEIDMDALPPHLRNLVNPSSSVETTSLSEG